MAHYRHFNRMALAATLAALPLYAHAAEQNTETFALQVALDHLGFSPGVIDGTMGRWNDGRNTFHRSNIPTPFVAV